MRGGRPPLGRIARAAALLAALLQAGAALAEVVDDRFLEGVEYYRVDGHIEIVIRLATDLRYVRHSGGPPGQVLQVQLAPGPGAGEASGSGRNTLRVPPSVDVPLDGISASVSGAVPTLVLHFLVPTAVERVESSSDDRTVTVWLSDFGLGEVPQRAPQPRAAPPPAARPPPSARAPAAPDIYVLHLAVANAPPAIEPDLAGQAGASARAYRTVSHAADRARYELRLGFFASSADATVALKRIGDRFPAAWITPVTPQERDLAMAGATDIDLAKISVRPDDAALPVMSVEALGNLMDDARRAATNGDYARASALYGRVASYPLPPYRQDALEAQGVMREKSGQMAQAKAAYESYLRQYPQGEDADRVRRRLEALIAATAPWSPPAQASRTPLAVTPVRGTDWDSFGSFSQYYRYDVMRPDDPAAQDSVQSILNNNLDLNLRRRSYASDLRLRASGSYDANFEQNDASQARASVAYLEFNTRDQVHTARLGRQTRGSSGVLGRLDGLYYGLRLGEGFRFNLAAGAPVATTSAGLDSRRQLYSVGAELGPWLDGLTFNVYGVHQSVDGLADRRAVGLETRYVSAAGSLFALADYDALFQETNIATVSASANLGEATTLSLVADRRMAPLLTTSNALLGQAATTMEALKTLYTETELRQLARDRTAVSTSYTGGLSQALSARFRVAADVTTAQIGATPASGGVAETPASGPDWYYGLQFVGNNLLQDGDIAILGARYVDAESYRSVSGTLSLRLRLYAGLSVTPRLRVDRRTPANGEAQMIYAPALRASWSPRRSFTLDLEATREVYGEAQNTATSQMTMDFYYLGYRYDF